MSHYTYIIIYKIYYSPSHFTQISRSHLPWPLCFLNPLWHVTSDLFWHICTVTMRVADRPGDISIITHIYLSDNRTLTFLSPQWQQNKYQKWYIKTAEKAPFSDTEANFCTKSVSARTIFCVQFVHCEPRSCGRKPKPREVSAAIFLPRCQVQTFWF